MAIEQARKARIDDFFTKHGAALARQGPIVATWRRKGGRRLGPYHRLDVGDKNGRKVALYLGRESDPRVADVRARLAHLQHRCRQRRQLAQACRILRRGERAWMAILSQELQEVGLRSQGLEVRGLARVKGVFERADPRNGRRGKLGDDEPS